MSIYDSVQGISCLCVGGGDNGGQQHKDPTAAGLTPPFSLGPLLVCGPPTSTNNFLNSS